MSWLAATLLLTSTAALAQFTSNLRGTVKDPAGSLVPNASVTVVNTETNVALKGTTTSDGQYTFSHLAPGSYRVEVEASGFTKTSSTVRLTTEQTAGLDVVLSAAGAAETVTVTADDGHGLNPDETRTQYTLSTKEITDFPLQNRATLGLVRVAPGVTGISEGQTNISINRTTARESANGRPASGNYFLLDYVPINSELSNTAGAAVFVPHPDMLGEVALQTTTYSVENTASTGIEIAFTSKTGTNRFHGDGDYSYTSRTFSAVAPFQAANAAFRRQFVSGALGGPIWKDRTFFFGSYFNQQVASPSLSSATYYAPEFVAFGQQYYPNSRGISRGLAPNPATRAANSTVVAYGRNLSGTDPVTGATINCGQTGYTIQALPCDLPVERSALNLAPQNNNGQQYNFRLDHTLRQGKDRIYASFFRFDQTSISARLQPTLDGATPSTGWYLAGSWVHQLNGSLLNQVSFGQTRFDFNYTTTDHSRDQVQLPYSIGCYCSGSLQIQFLQRQTEHQSFGRDSLVWTKGRHNMTFGFEASYNNEVSNQSGVYARPFAQRNYSIYHFLQDITDQEQIYTISAQTGKFIPQIFGAVETRFGIYAQDAFKVTPNLLLTYGLRWDDFGNPAAYGPNAEPFANGILGTTGDLNTRVANLVARQVNSVFVSRRNGNFFPRAAFAYTPRTPDHKLVIHGGAGLYGDALELYQINNNLPTQPPVRLSLDSTVNNFTPITSFGNSDVQGPPGGNPYGHVFPVFGITSFNSAGAPVNAQGQPVVGNINGAYNDLKPQKAVIFSLGGEQELSRGLVAAVQYSGTYAYDIVAQPDINTYTGRGTAPRYSTSFGRIQLNRNVAVSNYNALITSLRQASRWGLSYNASYTWGKTLSDPISNFTDQQNIHGQYTNAAQDVRNRFSLVQNYEIPSKFKSGLLNEGLAGWSLNNVIVAQTGTPFTIADTSGGANDYNQDGVSYDIPIYTGSVRNFGRSAARTSAYRHISVFSSAANLTNAQAAFAKPAVLQTQGRQFTFRGPGYFSLDSGVTKKFSIPFRGEAASLQLRAEATNLLNRSNFQNPQGEYSNVGQLGYVTTAYQGRILQIGGRFQF